MSKHARICSANRGIHEVLTPEGVLRATLPGRLSRDAGGGPVVGDRVVLNGQVIQQILPRATLIRRRRPGTGVADQPLAANVDVAMIVTGLDANYNLRRVERYLVMVRAGGVRPVVVLNKADCGASPWARLEEAEAVAGGAQVVLTSARDGMGLDEIRGFIGAGETAVFLGSSGAGKSTIINRLLGRDAQTTGEVRDSDGRGRHTTTSRHLIPAPDGWFVIDTPGLRELEPWVAASEVSLGFEEIEELAARCRFRNCRHIGEAGCAVAAEVAPERLANYHKLLRDAERLAAKTDIGTAVAEKQRIKSLHKMYRSVKKEKTR